MSSFILSLHPPWKIWPLIFSVCLFHWTFQQEKAMLVCFLIFFLPVHSVLLENPLWIRFFFSNCVCLFNWFDTFKKEWVSIHCNCYVGSFLHFFSFNAFFLPQKSTKEDLSNGWCEIATAIYKDFIVRTPWMEIVWESCLIIDKCDFVFVFRFYYQGLTQCYALY